MAEGTAAAEEEDRGDAGEKDGGSPLTLEEVEAIDLLETAKDKFECRRLQRTLLRGEPEASQLIFTKAEPHFMELVNDQYGNYLSQKCLEVANAEQFDHLFALLKGSLKELAQDVHGTRAVQKVVDQAISRGKVDELLEVLPGDLLEKLARSVTGFHVVVKLVESLPVQEAEALLEQLCGSAEKAVALGQDQWGCCVLKKCIDRSEGTMRQRVVDAIADSTLKLVQDPYGNYVVQHLLFMGHQRMNANVTRIIDAMKGQMFELSLQKFSSNVLEKCLLNSSDKDRNKIINEILNPEGCAPSKAVKTLLFHQYGNYVFQQSLEVAKDPQFSLLVEHSKQCVQDVIRSMPQGNSQGSPSLDLPEGSLAPEHVKRLCLKLVKKYPPLSDGLDLDGAGLRAWGGYYDPYANGFGGMDAYGAQGAWAGGGMPLPASSVYGYPFPGWDAGFGGYPMSYPFAGKGMGKGGRGRGGNRPRSPGKGRPGPKTEGGEPRPKAGKQAGAAEAGGGQGGGPVKVGRIVGFWPNYTITYDEVPAPGESNGNHGGRPKKAKGKAAAKA